MPRGVNKANADTEELVRFANLLIDAGRDRDVERLVKHAFMIHRNFDYGNYEIIGVLARVALSDTLKFLREIRKVGVRSWEQERNGYRLGYGAIATLRLRRPKQATNLFELAV